MGSTSAKRARIDVGYEMSTCAGALWRLTAMSSWRCESAVAMAWPIVPEAPMSNSFMTFTFLSNLLHALGRNAGRVGYDRELITAERCRTENIDDVKCVLP